MKVLAAFVVVVLVLVGCASAASPIPVASDPVRTPSISSIPPSTSPASQAPSGSAIDAELHPRGIGDVLLADLGNPGLDVTHYDVEVAFDAATGVLDGSVLLSITATADLADFSLDAVELQVDSIVIDGQPARFDAAEPELVITPAAPIAKGDSFEVAIVYSATPHPQQGVTGIPNGWFVTPGGTFVMNEPDGARAWLPSNDHPSDKATYRFTVHTPAGSTGIANGVLEQHSINSGDETWVWSQMDPMATYLIQVITGDYEIIDTVGPNGIPLTSAVLRSDRTLMEPLIEGMPDQIAFFEERFGPYPLSSYGIAVTDSPDGTGMEQTGRPLYSRDNFAADRRDDARPGLMGVAQQYLLSHELAHMWFGDAVTPAVWQDIWLNESFATYAGWMWLEHLGYRSLPENVDSALRERQRASVPTGAPSVGRMFDFEVYEGGAVVLQALRRTIGDDAFFTLLRTWVAENKGASRGTNDFIALAERIAGVDLTTFFDEWLFATSLPARLPD